MNKPQRIELKVTSDTANLAPVRKQVEQFAQDAGFPQDASDSVGLALNEAMANVIRHGYDGAKDKPIIITAEADADALHLTIRDWAKPFDPPVIPTPSPDNLKPGGLGVMCMRHLMDDVKFQRLSDGMLLTMVKSRRA
jgi:anti-sigma regulatory factor (Ser/Thr protein kinase)